LLLIASSRYLSGALFLNGPLRVRVLSPSHAVGLSRGRSPRSGDHERAGPDACGHQRRARDWVTRSALRPRRDNLRRGRFCQGLCEKPSGEGQQARLGDALPWAHAMEREAGSVTLASRAQIQPGANYYWNDIPIPPEMVRKGKLYGRASLTAILRPLGGLLTGGHQNARAEGLRRDEKSAGRRNIADRRRGMRGIARSDPSVRIGGGRCGAC
jgi:hypothetical protein